MLQPGSRIGRYEIQRKLARGGMGTVYVAQDPVLGRMVALKVFLGDLDVPDAAERFGREARAAAALNHSNIVTIFDFGEVDSQPYIVMEYIQGETLAEFITRKTPVPLIEKLRWLEELCAGVASAHKMDVVHRDIKPSNLMIDRSGRLKILDFGIAKLLGSLGSAVTAVIGTPGYMAPEQLLGQPVDGRTDLFSIGIVAFELLTYREAFSGDTFTAITHRIINEDVRHLGELVPEAPPELCDLVARAVQKDPALRYQDADSLRIQLGRVRRQLESHHDYDGADAPTIISPIALPVRRATGAGEKAGEKPAFHGFRTAELTPPPNPTTQREAQARVRASRIASALELGESSLQSGDLEAAREACVQIRALDATSTAAADLERRLHDVEVRQEAAHLLAEARTELARGALTTCRTLLDRARERDPEARDPELERDLRMARAEQERRRHRAESVARALTSARDAAAADDDEAALAWAREALALAPDSDEAKALEAQALANLQEITERSARQAESAPTPAAPAPVVAPSHDDHYDDDAPTIVASLPLPRLTPSPVAAPPVATPEPVPEPSPVRSTTDPHVAAVPPPPPLPPLPVARTTSEAAPAPSEPIDLPVTGPVSTPAPAPLATAMDDDAATIVAPMPAALAPPVAETPRTRKEPLTVRDPAAHPVPPRASDAAAPRAGSPARSAAPRPAAPIAATTGPVPAVAPPPAMPPSTASGATPLARSGPVPTPTATPAPEPVAPPATDPAPASTSSPVIPAARTPAVPAKAPAAVPAGTRPAGGTLTRTQQLLVVGVLGVVFLVAAVLILLKLLGGSGPPTGQQGAVVLEALPWAQVTAITDSDGVNQLATPAPTPFSTTVPVGRYTVTFRGPNGAERTVTVDVAAEGIAVAPVARFEDVSGQTYFDKYFKPTTPPAPVPDAGTPATSPAGGQP